MLKRKKYGVNWRKVPERIDICYHCHTLYTRTTNEEDDLSVRSQKNEKSVVLVRSGLV